MECVYFRDFVLEEFGGILKCFIELKCALRHVLVGIV